MLSLGVDVSVARGLDLVLLDGERRLAGAPLRRQSAGDLGRLIAERRPDVVAIDSPPAFGRAGSCRSCERELARFGISLYATPSDAAKTRNKFYDWMRAGHAAFAAARDAGYPLFTGGASVRGRALEVFPHASAVALKGSLPPSGTSKRASAKRRWRSAILEAAGVATAELGSLDEIDAALAALTGLFALEGEFWTAGDAGEPLIVLPSRRPAGRFARESERAAVADLEKVNLAEKFALITEHWRPKVAAELNGQEMKLVKLRGTFVWHHHEREDELFLVVRGRLKIELRDRAIELAPASSSSCLVASSIGPSRTRRPKCSSSSPPRRATPATSSTRR